MTDATLDATGLLCPLPVLKARKALKPLPAGAVLTVRATDPGAAAASAAGFLKGWLQTGALERV